MKQKRVFFMLRAGLPVPFFSQRICLPVPFLASRCHLLCLLLASLLLLAACKPDGEISGTLTYTDYYDGCRYPAGSAKIVKVQLLGGGREKSVSTVAVDYQGAFVFSHVEDGTWLLRATLKKEDVLYEAVSETLYVDGGKAVRCNFNMEKSAFTY